MKTLFLDAGHSLTDSGAVAVHNGVSFKESELTIALRNAMLQILDKDTGFRTIHDSDNHNLVRTCAAAKAKLQKGDWLCSLHFNAGSATASGVEVFVAEDASLSAKTLGQLLCNLIATELNIPNRGVKSETESAHKRLGILHCSTHALLIEVCFISSESDMSKYQAKQATLAQQMALTIAKHIIKS